MREDRERWNSKYRQKPSTGQPIGLVTRFAQLAPRGLALDLAAGSGRHARYLAELGFTVEALDIAEMGLANLRGVPGVRLACVDLDRFDLPGNRYQLILTIRYLNRRLFPQMIRALSPGGLLLIESFLAQPPGSETNPRFRREYLLAENELLHAFRSLHIVYYQEHASNDEQCPPRVASLAARRR